MKRWTWVLLSTGAVACASVALGSGCLDRPIGIIAPNTSFINSQRAAGQAVNKIDILLAIDNSSSMSDKQKLLAVAVPDLVDRLVSPRCLDKNQQPSPTTIDVTENCPDGFVREFPPILDINVGVISSSLGDLNGGFCKNATPLDTNDNGHLVTRDPAIDTYEDQGFLAWDPNSQRDPPGLKDSATFKQTLTNLVTGVGEQGCGYEMQLESIYRFLVDPAPYNGLVDGPDEGGKKTRVKDGQVDTELLAQRAEFLRPDSLVAIVILSDENDCSVKTEGTGYAVIEGGNKRASSLCDSKPNDKCCYSCGDAPPAGCQADAACDNPNLDTTLGHDEDDTNLRCWNQKRRFGKSALYPVERYVNAFTQAKIDPAADNLAVTDVKKAVDNPLFSDQRGSDLVFVAGIVGVPWQAIARRDASGPNLALGFEKVSVLEDQGFFDEYVGDPDAFKEPTVPLMIESVEKREGVTASDPNGGDRDINLAKSDGRGDLQYTCIYELADRVEDSAFCAKEPHANPLCSADGAQTHAKAYPSLRELAVLGKMGDQGIPASICPANADPAETSAPFGYGPAVATIIERLKEKLSPGCFNRKLKTDMAGGAACVVVEATRELDGQVDCQSLPGRREVASDEVAAVDAIKNDPSYPSTKWNSFCAIPQLSTEPAANGVSARLQCQTMEADDILDSWNVDGWCYVDASSYPAIGNPELTDFRKCATNEQRLVRFVGDGAPRGDGVTFITCVGQASE